VHSTAYCQAVENAAEIVVPDRGRYIRTILLELERVQSHLLWLGIAGHIIGFDTVLMQAWRIREPVMWLCEKITGNRKLLGMNLVGGVRRDIPKEIHAEILQVLLRIEKETKQVLDAIITDTTLFMRCKNVCKISAADAVAFSLLGPTARASGIGRDIRVDHPYAAYAEVGCQVIVETGEDIWSRVVVRMKETIEAIRIIRDCLAVMPKGAIIANIEQPIPSGRIGVSSVEAPRGETHHYVVTGEDSRPYRWKARAPTFQNLQAIPVMVHGESIADVPIGLGSMDPCFSCTERLETVDIRSGQVRVYTKAELNALCKQLYSIEKSR
jgi:Ni,Fe-hydrogenase III large subunit